MVRLAGPDALRADMDDAQWEIVEPLWFTRLAGRKGRSPGQTLLAGEIVDAILYVVDNGIKWQALMC